MIVSTRLCGVTSLLRRRPLQSNIDSYGIILSRRSLSSSSSSSVLHHEWVVDGRIVKASEDPTAYSRQGTVLFLHGLLGSGKNLRAPAKKLTEMNPHLSALLLDLRGHGSTSANGTLGGGEVAAGPHSFEACVGDIVRTLHSLGLVDGGEGGGDVSTRGRSPVGVVGHSFGGRIALQYLHALLHSRPQRQLSSVPFVSPPRSTWLLDTVPGSAHGSVAGVVEAVSSVSMPIESKKVLVEELTKRRGVDPAIAMWMTTNLTPVRGGSRGGFDFAFDLGVVQDVLEDFPRQDFAGMLRDVGDRHTESAVSGDRANASRVNLVMAGKNQAWTEVVRAELEDIKKMGHLDAHVLEEAGHWVHVDDLEGLMVLMGKCGFD